MEVILLEDISNLGKLGSVVKVKPGYARNYLIPQGKVKKATPDAVEEFRVLRVELEKAQAEKLAQAEALAAQLSGLTLQIISKAGVDGRLFGSVTHQDIAEELGKMGFQVPKSAVQVPSGHLKQVGEYSVTLVLHSKVSTEIQVAVLGDH